MNIQGYWYKTITVNTTTGVRKYQFQTANTNDLALPQGSVVLGMFCRRFELDSADKDYLGNTLVNADVNRDTFFTILGKYGNVDANGKCVAAASLKDFIKQYEYPVLSDPPLFFEKKVVTDVDWAHSNIIIGEGCAIGDIADNEAFEFIVFYQPPLDLTIGESFKFRSGEVYENYNYITLEIPTLQNITKYRISNQNSVGIDNDCILIGLDLRRDKRNFSGTPVLNSNALQCGFLNFFIKTTQFVDNIPINLQGIPQPAFDKPYLPIAPIRIGDIAWEKSNLFFSDQTSPQDNEAYSIGLIYTQPGG